MRPAHSPHPPGSTPPGSKNRQFTSGRYGWFWQHQPRTQAGQDGSPGRCRPPAPPPRYAERTAVRAFIATADGTGAPVIRPALAELVPEACGLNGLPRAVPDVLRVQMPHAHGCPKAPIARRCGRVLVPRRPAGSARSVTVSSGACIGGTRAEPLCVELRSPAMAGGATELGVLCGYWRSVRRSGWSAWDRRDRRGTHALLLLYCAGGGQPGHVRPRIRYGPYDARARHRVQGGPVR